MILELLLVLALVALVWVATGWLGRRIATGRLRLGRGSGGRRFRCHDCRFLLQTYDDGVSCGVGGGRIFKTPVHVANCMDHDPR